LNQFYKNLALWLVISLMMILLFNLFNKPKPVQDKLSYSDFIASVQSGKVTSVIIQGNDVIGKYADGKEFHTYKPDDATLSQTLLESKVAVTARPEEEKVSWLSIFISWFPLILLVGVWIFFMRQMQSGGGKAMSFGKSRAKLLTEAQVKVTFEYVAGVEVA
jgi:cell division protease FtsH